MVHDAPVALTVAQVELNCSFNEFIGTNSKKDWRVRGGTHNCDDRKSRVADLIMVTSSKMRSLVVKSA